MQGTEAGIANHQSPQDTGDLQRTAQMTTELADTSVELKHFLISNSQLMEKYSQELIHVQSLAAQLVQMQNMQL